MHEAAKTYVRQVLKTVSIPKGAVLEIGGRNINGTVRPLFDAIGPYASIDLYDGPGVDLVADVCELDPAKTARKLFGKMAVSCVVCCEVLEHAVRPLTTVPLGASHPEARRRVDSDCGQSETVHAFGD